MWYKTFLPKLHEILGPERYVEIGIRHGYSLSLSPKAKKVAIDPAYGSDDMQFSIARADFYKMTSDDFFAKHNLQDIFGAPFDLGYIDGLHKFEFGLRDLLNLESASGEDSVIIVDDVLPRTLEEASREPTGGSWAGDVWKIIACLKDYRPKLASSMILAKSEPTGCLIILNPDENDTVLKDHYDEILAKYLAPDYPSFPSAEVLALAIPAEDALKLLRTRNCA